MLSRYKKLNRWLLIGGLIAPFLITVADAAAARGNAALRIHRYSEFNAEILPTGQRSAAAITNSRELQRRSLKVYGRQLVLSLENNARLNSAPTSAVLLRGNVENQAGSWVRLAHTLSGTHGLIWDGTDLYAVEPSADVDTSLAVSLPTPTSETVIFKLSDTTIDLGSSCGLLDQSSQLAATGMATYQALTAELSATQDGTQSAPSLLLELQAITDAAFRAQYVSDEAARSALLVRLNNIDGIFTAQMGLSIVAADVQINSNDPAGLSGSTEAGELLQSLGSLRSRSPVMGTYAATHLFTGRDLDGDTLGIAYVGHVCGARYGSSLSEVRNRGVWIDSLVAAHEIGHQLGAVHDGSGACADTASQSFLMGAQINGSSELSQCSRDTILNMMQSASCLVPMQVGPVSANPESTSLTAPSASDSGGGALQPGWLLLSAWLWAWRALSSARRPTSYRSAR